VFKKDEYIIRQGSHGETFYIMVEGEVLVTAKLQNDSEPSEIRTLTAGAYFGEKALLGLVIEFKSLSKYSLPEETVYVTK